MYLFVGNAEFVFAQVDEFLQNFRQFKTFFKVYEEYFVKMKQLKSP